MKNTEYKDVFDFGEEALSMENKFSAPSFPSFKNAFILGENIRGMTNVSPLATVKFFNQTPDDLLTKYYPDSGPVVEGTFAVVQDIGTDPEPVITKTVKDFYYYGLEEVNNFAFRVILFSSTDATKLKESFEVSAPSGREILMFVEDNRSDKASGTYGAIKISADVLHFLNKSGRLEYDLYNNREMYTEIKKVIPELEDDQIKSLLQKGYIEDIRVGIAQTYFKLASFFSSGLSFINPGLGILTNEALRAATGILLEKVILLIEKTKLDENRWQPKPPKLENGEPDASHSYQPLISSGKDGNGSVNFSEITGLLKNMLKDQNDTVRLALNIKKDFRKNGQPKGFLELLYNLYMNAYDIMYDVITGLDEMADLDILKYGAWTFNALVCGVWNGLVDSVAGLFAMIKMIYDGITLGKDFAKNIEEYLPALLEQFDEAVQAIRNISFTDTAQYIYGKLKEINLTFDPVACAYFTGYAFGFIISLIIEIIVGALVSGGVLDIPIIIEKLEEAIFGIFRLGWGMAKGAAKKIRTFSKFVVKSVKDLIKGFQELVNFLKKGREGIKRLIDDFFVAFKEYYNELKNLHIIPNNQAEINLFKKLMSAFYKEYRILLLESKSLDKVVASWKNLNAMSDLSVADMKEMLAIRVKFLGNNDGANVAIMRQKIRVNGKIEVLEYKSLAGKGGAPEGFCPRVEKSYLEAKLDLKGKEFDIHFKDDIQNRLYDSEHNMFFQNDKDLQMYFTRYGKNNVEILETHIKTLYEPCPSCQKQLLIRKEMYKIKDIKVEAVRFNNQRYVQNNRNLIDMGIVIIN